jgi:hypothetical protein
MQSACRLAGEPPGPGPGLPGYRVTIACGRALLETHDDRASRVVAARLVKNASRLGHGHVGAEHLLLAGSGRLEIWTEGGIG